MNPATAGDASNYQVDSVTTKRVKKKSVKVFKPIPIPRACTVRRTTR